MGVVAGGVVEFGFQMEGVGAEGGAVVGDVDAEVEEPVFGGVPHFRQGAGEHLFLEEVPAFVVVFGHGDDVEALVGAAEGVGDNVADLVAVVLRKVPGGAAGMGHGPGAVVVDPKAEGAALGVGSHIDGTVDEVCRVFHEHVVVQEFVQRPGAEATAAGGSHPVALEVERRRRIGVVPASDLDDPGTVVLDFHVEVGSAGQPQGHGIDIGKHIRLFHNSFV